MKRILALVFVIILILVSACGGFSDFSDNSEPVFELVPASAVSSPPTTMRDVYTDAVGTASIALSPAPDIQRLLTEAYSQAIGYDNANARQLFSDLFQADKPAALAFDRAEMLLSCADAYKAHTASLLLELQRIALPSRVLAIEEAEALSWRSLAALGFAFGEDCFDKLIECSSLESDFSSYVSITIDSAALYAAMPKERVLDCVFLYAALKSFADDDGALLLNPLCSDFSVLEGSVVSPCEWTQGYSIWPAMEFPTESFCGVRFNTNGKEFCSASDSRVLLSGSDERYGAWIMLGDAYGYMYIYAGLDEASPVSVGGEYTRGQTIGKASSANGVPYLYLAILSQDYVFIDAYELFLSQE